MIKQEPILAIIPARGGSKGLRDKNIKLLLGKPLIAWTIEAALKSMYIDKVIVSSDAQKIIDVGIEFGAEAPFVRPAHLAQDDSSTFLVVADVLQRYPHYEWVVLLQPTSPLRLAQDIDAAVEQCIQKNAPACVSVSLASETPYWMYTVDNDGKMNSLLEKELLVPRQKLPPIYSLNGAVYVARKQWLLNNKRYMSSETVAYVMPEERSIDIDTEMDFFLAEFLMHKLK